MTRPSDSPAERAFPHSLTAVGVWAGVAAATALCLLAVATGALTVRLSPLSCGLIVGAALGLNLASFAAYRAAASPSCSGGGLLLQSMATLCPPMVLGLVFWPTTWGMIGLFLAGCYYILAHTDPPQASVIPANAADREPAEERGSIAIEDASTTAGGETSADWPRAVAAADLADEPHGDAGEVVQWMQRSKLGKRQELIEGTVRVEFTPGQKQATIHLTFWPPLCERPALECQILNDVSVRLKVASLYTFGARIEAKRSQLVDEAADVEIGFTASTGVSKQDAA